MLYTEKTEFGTLRFGTQLIGNIVKHAISGMGGKLMLSGPKGKSPRGAAKPNEGELSFLRVSLSDMGVDLTVYVVIRFGAGIKSSASRFTKALRAEIPAVTGLKVNRVTISITGIFSKNFSRRSIEITSYA
jgi:uncharacterized alkaline shock family protein YloU